MHFKIPGNNSKKGQEKGGAIFGEATTEAKDMLLKVIQRNPNSMVLSLTLGGKNTAVVVDDIFGGDEKFFRELFNSTLKKLEQTGILNFNGTAGVGILCITTSIDLQIKEVEGVEDVSEVLVGIVLSFQEQFKDHKGR